MLEEANAAKDHFMAVLGHELRNPLNPVLAIATIALARWASADAWRGELVPVLLFAMTMAVVYRRVEF